MAQTDWATLTGALVVSDSFRAGATAGETPPNGGGSFVYGWHALETPTPPAGGGLAHGKILTVAGFTITKGISIRGCVKRGLSAALTGFSPFIYASLQGDSVLDKCYMLGLSDEDPARIVLRKGQLMEGVPAVEAENHLRASVASVLNNVWAHLRLDVITNDNGDVVLLCYKNDLTLHPCHTPTWELIPMDDALGDNFIDDVLGDNSGTVPLLTGNAGFAMRAEVAGCRSFADYMQAWRQL